LLTCPLIIVEKRKETKYCKRKIKIKSSHSKSQNHKNQESKIKKKSQNCKIKKVSKIKNKIKDYSSIKCMSKEGWYGLNGVGGWGQGFGY
jgi:hypothetical protein